MKTNGLPRTMVMGALGLIALISLSLGASRVTAADPQESLEQLQEKLRVLREWKAKGEAKIRILEEELARNPDHLNMALVAPMATAAGYRGEEYQQAPEYIKKLLDDFEKEPFGLLADGAAQATPAVKGQGVKAAEQAHFRMEIGRKKRFHRWFLDRQITKVIGQIEALGGKPDPEPGRGPDDREARPDSPPQPAADLNRMAADIEAALAQLKERRAEVMAAWRELEEAQRSARAAAGESARLLKELAGLRGRAAAQAARLCAQARARRGRISAAATQLAADATAAAGQLAGAEAQGANCQTPAEANAISQAVDGTKTKLAKTGREIAKAQADNDALKELLTQIAEANQAALSEAEGMVQRIQAAAGGAAGDRAKSASGLATDKMGELERARDAVRGQIEGLRAAFPNQAQAKERSEDLLSRLDAVTAVPPADALEAAFKGAEESVARAKEQWGAAQQYLDALKASLVCDVQAADDEVAQAEDARQQAAEALDSKGTVLRQAAAACLARSQPPIPVSSGVAPPSAPVPPGSAPNQPPIPPVSMDVTPPTTPGWVPPLPPTTAPPGVLPPAPAGITGSSGPWGVPPAPIPPAVPGPAPLAAVIRGGPARVATGETVRLAAAVNGGRPPYRYRWEAGGSSAVDQTEVQFTPRTPGPQIVRLIVWDQDGRAASATYTVAVDEAVRPALPASPSGGGPAHAAPLAAHIEGPTAPVEVNQTVVLRAAVRGGREPYRYRWEVGGKTVEEPVARLIPHGPGDRTVRLTVRDRDDRQTSATIIVAVRDSAAAAQAARDRQAAEQARLAEERRRAELHRRQQEEQARLQREKELRDLRASVERWKRDLACLEEGKRKFPKYELNCNGNWLIGSRDGAIEQLRRNIRDGERRLAASR